MEHMVDQTTCVVHREPVAQCQSAVQANGHQQVLKCM